MGTFTAPQTALGQIISVSTWEDVDTYNTLNYTTDQLVALESYKFRSWRGFKVYRNNRPLAA